MAPSQRQLEERKMRKTRILLGALSVFKSKGLEGATMDEIATQSGFGKATLYYYFKSKEDFTKRPNEIITTPDNSFRVTYNVVSENDILGGNIQCKN